MKAKPVAPFALFCSIEKADSYPFYGFHFPWPALRHEKRKSCESVIPQARSAFGVMKHLVRVEEM